MKNIGCFGEYATLSELLRHDIEAYPAISKNQEDYDITVVVNISKVVRLQVKTTKLLNLSHFYRHSATGLKWFFSSYSTGDIWPR